MINKVLVLRRLVLNVTKDLLIRGGSRVLHLHRAQRYLLAVRSPLFPLWRQKSCTRRGCAWPEGQEIFQTFRATSKNTPGTPQTVIQVVDAIVVEVFGQRLDSEADDDGGDDDDHCDDDDDWQVEEVTAFSVFITGRSLLDIIQDLALHHF